MWCVKDPSAQESLIKEYSNVEVTYLTDGHHRAASGRRYAEIMREEKGNNGDEPFNQLMVALFPDNQLNLLPFHRCVKDLTEKAKRKLLKSLANALM